MIHRVRVVPYGQQCLRVIPHTCSQRRSSLDSRQCSEKAMRGSERAEHEDPMRTTNVVVVVGLPNL